MTEAPESPDNQRGCGPLVAIALSIFCLTLGLVIGAAGFYAYLSISDDGLKTLRLAEPIEAPPPQAARNDGDDEIYALAHPIRETLDIGSDIDRAGVESQLVAHRERLRQCYLEELERAPDTRGELDVQFTIDGEHGEVVAGVTRNNRTGSEPLADCVVRQLREHFSFEPSETSGLSTIRFHVLFLPLGEGHS